MKLKLIKFNSVDSTNDEAIKLIRKNKITPSIITTNIQKKGKGTMGKSWISKKGNLFLSLFFEIKSIRLKANKFSILNPHIVKKVLSEYSVRHITIKWPNDLLIMRRKICGILQEVIEYKKKKFLIIGIGINTITSPKNKKFKSISLLECSNRNFKNEEILMKIKLAYEKIFSNVKKDQYLK